MPPKRILLLPAAGFKDGTGHKRRCEDLKTSLGPRASLLVDASGETGTAETGPMESRTPQAGRQGFLNHLAVFDRRTAAEDAVRRLAVTACPVLLDDDGPMRHRAPFVIDTLPGPRKSSANLASPGFMNLPPRKTAPNPDGPVLVSFGGEDQSALTSRVLSVMASLPELSGRLHATLPPGCPEIPENVSILNEPRNLKDRLGEFGLVICSYGMTAWEAVSSGTAVLTINPAAYHESLSRHAGFPSLGSFGPGDAIPPKRLKTILTDPGEKQALSRAADRLAASLYKPHQGEAPRLNALARLLGRLEAPRPACAACGSPLPPVTDRFPHRSFYTCEGCGITGLYRFRLPKTEYGPEYFNSEYRRQYGRSYLEDFPAIRSMALHRLKLLAGKLPPAARLLDIGCAFGPFLDAARDAGYRVFGTDISPEAAAHVRDNLGIPACTAAFPEEDPAALHGQTRFDAVTLWYVIEHFPNLEEVLTRLNGLLSAGGVLAFSTPNGNGISSRRNRKLFLERSPEDHYTIWTPRVAAGLLKRFGFRLYAVRGTGHHPERFSRRLKPGRPGFKIVGAYSRLRRLGDTFEAYAVKERNIH